TIVVIASAVGVPVSGIWGALADRGLNQVFFFNEGWADSNNFFKQFISGALITIVMTGLDQDMMQKNLTIRTIDNAQKNMFVFTIILVVANLLFLTLGGLLYVYAAEFGMSIPGRTDQLYPAIALEHLPPMIGVLFMLGLTAAAYSSADSTLTALTTAFCMDFLGFNKRPQEQDRLRRIRWR